MQLYKNKLLRNITIIFFRVNINSKYESTPKVK
jgi:hypothetical protein